MSHSKVENSLATRLAFVRSQSGLSQEAFSSKMGVSRSTYYHYERGSHDVPASFLQVVCTELDVDPVWLLLDQSADVLREDQNTFFEMYEMLDDFVEHRATLLGKPISIAGKREIIRIVADDFSKTIRTGDKPSIRTVETTDRLIGLIGA